MGITKLLHIKARSKGNQAAGLLNSIYYILNPEKTQNKRLVGGNCGTDEEMIYRRFMETKSVHGKFSGRQGYHFIISFPPDEHVSATQCMNVMSDFADEFLKGEYDFVFSVHTDTDHMHGHLVFNSVNALTGRKYRYEDGDWEKYIQPITDKIAEKYGLSRLEFVRNEEKDIDWNEKIKKDITDCIHQAKDYEDFKKKMQTDFNYAIREGYSKKYGIYLAYSPPGKRGAVRSYRLTKDCQPYDINRRIQLFSQPALIIPIVKAYYFSTAFYHKPAKTFLKWNQMSLYQQKNLRKIYQAQRLYKRTGQRPWENERIIRGINQTMKKYQFLLKSGIVTTADAEAAMERTAEKQTEVNKDIRRVKREYRIFRTGNPPVFDIYEQIVNLKDNSSLSAKKEAQLQKLSQMIEVNYVGEMYQEYQNKLNNLFHLRSTLRQEKKILQEIITELPQYQKQQKEKKSVPLQEKQEKRSNPQL